MSPQRRLFLVTWLGGLALVHHAWTAYAHLPEIEQEQGALQALSAVTALMPWLSGPGVMWLLRRMESGGVNIPYAEYWFAGERRSASLDRLAPYLDLFGALLTVFLAGLLALFISERIDLRASAHSALMFLAWTLAFLGATVWWVRRVLAAFPAPDAATRGMRRSASLRRRR